MVKKIIHFFRTDDTLDEAASLSFYTLFAIVPMLLIALALITRIEGFETVVERVNHFLVENLLPVNQQIISSYINEFIANSNQTGTMGVLFVIVTSVLFFMDYEYIINKIYKTKIRNYLVAILIYLMLTVLFPLMMILAFYISDEFQMILTTYTTFKIIDMNFILTFGIIWSIFFLSYYISPNKQMKVKAVFYASLFGTSFWTVAKNLFIYYVFYNTNYVSLYGQISIILLFMLWIFVHWIIFIYGLKFCKYLEDHIY
ncbi:MAG: YihY/virulence factor BrkB family protein [Campylobacterales bacterium]|nr:YihY/virulence factor BrkB family protein [Campylobacterales bacterium]